MIQRMINNQTYIHFIGKYDMEEEFICQIFTDKILFYINIIKLAKKIL